ncbi:MAG: hypothetical protein HRT36_08660 [Alphaproteobacteria bacterium]|nr:hypothetical protein [Alphaproteobacteria bacterium]
MKLVPRKAKVETASCPACSAWARIAKSEAISKNSVKRPSNAPILIAVGDLSPTFHSTGGFTIRKTQNNKHDPGESGWGLIEF